MRERGLKLVVVVGPDVDVTVAPHAGAWIEMASPRLRPLTVVVAPHAGAWIEIPIGRPPMYG